jgi:hypothetical protein
MRQAPTPSDGGGHQAKAGRGGSRVQQRRRGRCGRFGRTSGEDHAGEGGVDGTPRGGGRRGCLPREFRSGKARGLLAKEDRLTSVLVRRGGGQSENEPQRVDVFL